MPRPVGFICLGLVTPARPTLDLLAREQFQVGARTAALDQVVLLVGFAGVFLLAADEDVDLRAAGLPGAQTAADTEQQKLGDVAEVEAHAPAVGAAVLADLEPDEVGLVGET